MIFIALRDFAEREGLLENLDYKPIQVPYLIKIDEDGNFNGFISTKESKSLKEGRKGGKSKAKKFLIPIRSSRTAQNWPEFLVDKGEYVFGWPEDENDEKKIERAKIRQNLFLELIREAYERTMNDEGVGAVLNFLQKNQNGTISVARPEDWKNEDLFGFVYEKDMDTLVSSRDAVVSYWSAIRFFRVQIIKPEESVITQCAASGEVGPTVRLHPPIKGILPVSDTKKGVPLTSTDKGSDAFESYNLGNISCVPISTKIADGYAIALERLLSSDYPSPIDGSPLPKQNIKFSDNTIVVYWSRKSSEFTDFFSDAIEADPEAVGALYNSAWKGRPVNLDDPSAFYALTLSGAKGRATIRGCFESTVRDVVHNVKQHFQDLKITYPDVMEKSPFALKRLLFTTVAKVKPGEDPYKKIHPNLATDMFEAIIKGYAYPRIILDAAIRRIRAEQNISPSRAALIKAYLVRARRLGKLNSNFPEVKDMLDKECEIPAYRLGRLFSVLEKLQQDAVSSKITIRDRYYGAASATPVLVFGQLMKKSGHHLAKLEKESYRTYYEKLIQEIVWRLEPRKNPFPSSLSLEEQGLFALGYYHQRQALFTKSADKKGE